MNINKIPVWGQYIVELDGVECRAVLCPDVPDDPDDLFLSRAYQRAVKETTVKNMYSRWLNATGPLIKNKRMELVNWPCSIYSFTIQPPTLPYCMTPVAQAARAMNLVQTVVENLNVATSLHYDTVITGFDVEPQKMLLQILVPDASDFEANWFDNDDVISLINKL